MELIDAFQGAFYLRMPAEDPCPFTQVWYKAVDLEGGQLLLRTYCEFADEVHPNLELDRFYRLFRPGLFGSTKDVSPIFFLFVAGPSAWRAESIIYEEAGTQPYTVTFPKHERVVRPLDSVRIPGGDIRMRSATWNHLFSADDTVEPVAQCPAFTPLMAQYMGAEKFDNRFGDFNEFVQKALQWTKDEAKSYLEWKKKATWAELQDVMADKWDDKATRFLQPEGANQLRQFIDAKATLPPSRQTFRKSDLTQVIDDLHVVPVTE